jgi:hypothetical protein
MLKELRSQHRNIIQMSFTGFSNNDIAEKLEISHVTVSQVIRSPLGQAYLEGLQDRAQEATLDVRKQLISLNKDALATFTRILNPAEKAPHNVQLTAAKDVLDRNGFKAPDKHIHDITMNAKTDQEIDAEIAAMEIALKRNTLASDELIESETEESSEIIHHDEQSEQSKALVDSESLLDSKSLIDQNTQLEDDSVSDLFSKAVEETVATDDPLLSSIPTNLFKSPSN